MTTQSHSGAGMNIIPELAVQEALVLGLHQLAQDPKAINEMVQRLDKLKRGTQDGWEKALRDALIEMLTPSNDNYLQVLLGYPLGIEDLPALSIILASGGENEGEAVVADTLHTSWKLIQPGSRSERSQVLGTGKVSTVQIGAWSTAPERSLLLQAAAHWALFSNKGLLQERGVHEVTYQEGGAEPEEDMIPRVAYVPMITATLKWTFRVTHRDIVPNRVTICPGAFSA
jgi:hypothetical protein